MNPVTQIMRRVCCEYQMVVRMLEARGTPELVTFLRNYTVRRVIAFMRVTLLWQSWGL